MLRFIVWECRKILRKRLVAALLVCSFVLPAVWLTFSTYSTQAGDAYLPQDYKRLHEDIAGKDLAAAEEWLSELSMQMMMSGEEPEIMYTSSLRQEFFLYEQVKSELKQINGYKDYLKAIQEDGKRKGSVSLFQGKQSVVRNAKKTMEDFSVMEDVAVSFEKTRGMQLFVKTDVQDVMLVFVVLAVCAALVFTEVEEGTLQILRCAKYGRGQTVYAKYFAGALLVFFVQAAAYLYRFLLLGSAYSFDCLSASLPSLYGASGATLPVTIGEGMLLFFLLKLLASETLYSFVLLLGLLLKQSWKAYLAEMAVFAFFWISYERIDVNSYLALFKWVNPVAFLHTDTLLFGYRNLILLEYPVGYLFLTVTFCLLVLAVCLLLYRGCFLRLSVRKGGGVLPKLFAAVEAGVIRITGGRTLFGYEYRKWSFYQSGFFVCVVLLAVILATNTPVPEQIYTVKEIYYKHYVKQVEGPYSDEKLAYLQSEQEKLDDIKEKMRSGNLNSMLVQYYSRELDKEEGLLGVLAYGEYLKEKGGGSFLYEQGYERLFGKRDNFRLVVLRAGSLASMILLAAFLWGIDKKTGMNVLIRSSFTGERQVKRRKAANVFVAGTVVFCIFYIPWICNVFSVYGAKGLLAPAYSLLMFENVPGWIPVGGMLVFYYFLHLLVLWLAGFLVQFVFGRKKQNRGRVRARKGERNG